MARRQPSLLESLPPELLARIVELMKSRPALLWDGGHMRDCLSLSACCRALHAAARGPGGPWWAELRTRLRSNQAVAGFRNWMARQNGVRAVHLLVDAGVTAPILPKPQGPGLLVLSVCGMRAEQLADALAHTQLCSLRLPQQIGPLSPIPACISWLTDLHTLVIDTQVSGGLQHLAQLCQLTSLDIGRCTTTALPPGFSRLTTLRKLRAIYSQLAGGMEHLRGLSQLTNLNLYDSHVPALPPAFSTLTSLAVFYVAFAEQPAGFEHLARLSGLTALMYHAHTEAAELPEGLSMLTSLRRLCVGLEEALVGGWDLLRPLQRLTSLTLNWVIPDELPSAVSCLRELRKLHIMEDAPTAGWQYLTVLPHLQNLVVDSSSRQHMPTQLHPLVPGPSVDIDSDDENWI